MEEERQKFHSSSLVVSLIERVWNKRDDDIILWETPLPPKPPFTKIGDMHVLMLLKKERPAVSSSKL